MKLWGKVAGLLACLAAMAAEPALEPVPVCEAVAAWKDLEGKPVAVVGRYAFRRTERWLDQEACDGKDRRGMLRLVPDAGAAPKPPDTVALDERALEKKIALLKQRTALAKFRFGSPDYDRWAVVYGRLESRKEGDLALVYRGDGAVFFFVDK